MGDNSRSAFIVEIIRAHNVPRMDVSSDSDPFVKFWVVDSKNIKKTKKFKSLTREDNPHPIWNCIRNLGITPEPGDKLVIQLYDEDAQTKEAIGKPLEIPIEQLKEQEQTFQHPKYQIDIKLLPKPKSFKKTVFLIRHGESLWNEAQGKKHVGGLLHYDHPLSDIGIKQCMQFQSEWKHHSKAETVPERVKTFLSADCIFASPLTRAAQTCLITTDDHPFLQNADNGIVLWSAIREIKNPGGLDTVGNFLGTDIEKRVKVHCNESKAAAENLKLLSRFHVGDSEYQWWTSANNFDSKKQIKCRLEDVMNRIIYHPNQTSTILVGHSLFFKKFCSKFMSPEYLKTNAEKAHKIKKTLMPNATFRMLTIDFSGPTPFIVDYQDQWI